MIERKFVKERIEEFRIQEFVRKKMKGVGLSDIKMQKTPLGEKVIISTSRPGLVVGRKGENIKDLTKSMKKEFELENPQIEISEVEQPNLDPSIIAEKIVDFLERFGTSKFKGIGHRVMADVTEAGAPGIEIVISGKIPSSRAKSWRFYKGYLKKCGDTALTNVNVAYASAKLKTRVVGVKVAIMQSSAELTGQLAEEEEDKKETEEEDKKDPEDKKSKSKEESDDKKDSEKKEKETEKETKDEK